MSGRFTHVVHRVDVQHPGTAPKTADPLRPAAKTGSLDADRARILKLRGAFAATAREIDATLRALDGRYVPPGGGDPVRTPKALPTGQNLYGVNPAEIPTQSAWEVKVKLAGELIAAVRKRLGRYPREVGFNLWNTELIRQYGVDLAQILWLMGVRPGWDSRGVVTDLNLIPGGELKRPRIDVVIQAAAQFRMAQFLEDHPELAPESSANANARSAIRVVAITEEIERRVPPVLAAFDDQVSRQRELADVIAFCHRLC